VTVNRVGYLAPRPGVRGGEQDPDDGRHEVIASASAGDTCSSHGVVQSYRRENARVRTIREGFDLGVPYSIVTVAQVRKLMADAGYSKRSPRSNAPGADVFARFPGGRLVALSAVGFNAEKTRAMVAIQADCFPSWTPETEHPTCQEGRHVALEKKDGRWTIVQGVRVGCIWVA
jgi:hypothetical protein